jgi:hypothetical protein
MKLKVRPAFVRFEVTTLPALRRSAPKPSIRLVSFP